VVRISAETRVLHDFLQASVGTEPPFRFCLLILVCMLHVLPNSSSNESPVTFIILVHFATLTPLLVDEICTRFY
jgi:hypothetical protein